ncbi:Amidase domain-containing protein [Aphelenchoides fujianensis]|nr:Amidase domain-containing protein [Aphelenchoides fujianensis]
MLAFLSVKPLFPMLYGRLVVPLLHVVLQFYFNVVHTLFSVWNHFKKRTIVPKPIDDEHNQLLQISAVQAAELIRSRKVILNEIVLAPPDRSVHPPHPPVNRYINAVCRTNFEEALEMAENVDRTLDAMNPEDKEAFRRLRVEKPLLGVPFTVKDTIRVKGMVTVAGLVAFRDNPPNEMDAEVVQKLKNAGAIPLAASNVPEGGLAWESVRSGRTNHPFDSRRNPGGSCGGDAALLATGCSLLSVGSDIAGSLRIPASLCGVFGLKPTSELTSTVGHIPETFPGYLAKMISLGPMVRFAGDLNVMLKVLVGPEIANELKLDERVNLRKLRVFYMRGLTSFSCSSLDADGQNALQKAVKYFSKKYDLSPYAVDFPIAHHALDIVRLSMRGGMPVVNCLEGFQARQDAINLPLEIIRWFFGFSDHTAAALCGAIYDELNAIGPDVDFLISKREQLKRELLDLLSENTVLVFPALPRSQYWHNEPLWTPFEFAYTGLWNALGLPVVAVPMGLSVQLVGGPKSERLLIACAQDLEEGYGGHVMPSRDDYY